MLYSFQIPRSRDSTQAYNKSCQWHQSINLERMITNAQASSVTAVNTECWLLVSEQTYSHCSEINGVVKHSQTLENISSGTLCTWQLYLWHTSIQLNLSARLNTVSVIEHAKTVSWDDKDMHGMSRLISYLHCSDKSSYTSSLRLWQPQHQDQFTPAAASRSIHTSQSIRVSSHQLLHKFSPHQQEHQGHYSSQLHEDQIAYVCKSNSN